MSIKELSPGMVLACLSRNHDELGGQAINLFRSALSRSNSNLLELYLRPNLIHPDKAYIYIAEDNGGKGSRPNYDPANSLVAPSEPPESDLAIPGRWGLFTNPLRWVDIKAGGPRPSDRPVNIGFTVYTLEFDKIPFCEQLQAICGGGLHRTAEILGCFKDFGDRRLFMGATRASTLRTSESP